MKISEVLIKARDIIQEKGWVKGSWHDVNGEVCLETAIAEAVGERNPSRANLTPAGKALAAYLGLTPPSGPQCMCGCGLYTDGESLASWNDSQPSVESVIEALEVCALIEAEKEAREPKVAPPSIWVPEPMITWNPMPAPVMFKVKVTDDGTLVPVKQKELVSV